MLAIALLSAFLSFATPQTTDPRLTGVWVLNQQKSDWGGLAAPGEVILRIEQTDQSVAIWEVATSGTGRRVSYRQIILKSEKCAGGVPQGISLSACFVTAQSAMAEERWELSQLGELIVDREARQGVHLVHQRLVLEPSVVFSE
jgi:hypothetical protein